VFRRLDTHTTHRAEDDASREISAKPDDKFAQLAAVLSFQQACNCVRFARFGASEPHAELGLALGADKEARTRVHRTVRNDPGLLVHFGTQTIILPSQAPGQYKGNSITKTSCLGLLGLSDAREQDKVVGWG
jgi:hypothetical protein